MKQKTLGWGVVTEGGAEIWDAQPVFTNTEVTWKDKAKLIFYPKKFLLYRYIYKAFLDFQKGKRKKEKLQTPFKVLDVGCGTGGTIVDLKRLLGRRAEIVGVDVVQLQIDLAKQKIKEYGVWPKVRWYDGVHFPFANNKFDVVYASDVLGHVENVQGWLKEINRIVKPGGLVVMFSESKLGKHAYIRNYLLKKGLNTDPHKEFHISLYSKDELKKLFDQARLPITNMYSSFWAKFWVHPDELYPALQDQNKFFILKFLNKILFKLKKKTHPFSTALAELYGLLEMVTIGRKIESQGYTIRAKKK